MEFFAIFVAGILLYFGGSALLGDVGIGSGDEGSAPSSPINEGLSDPGILTGVAMSITNNPATWPSGDLVWRICQAIAIAEGANVAGSNPDRLNNPGDISDGGSTYPQESHSGSNVTVFPTKEIGWSWLYEKVERAVNGNSSVYLPSMTWNEIAQKWAGNWQAWVNNVTSYLGVDPNSTLSQFTGIGG